MKGEERREGMVRRLLSTAVAAALLLGSVTGAVLGAETTQGMPTGAVSGAAGLRALRHGDTPPIRHSVCAPSWQ